MRRRSARVGRNPAGRRLASLAGVAAVAVLTVIPAGPAAAHDTSLPDAQFYRSTITSVTPAVPGLQIQITRSGESVTLTNHTGSTVTVLGYEGEDYLRVTPTGVDENTNSLSAFLNGSLVISGLPQQLGQNGRAQSPAWKHVADTPSYSWHDHRAHWMAAQRPPVVAADPGAPHHVFDWAMDLEVGARPVAVKGSLDWIGTPWISGLPLALLVVVGVATGLCLVLFLVRLHLRRKAGSGPAGAAGTGGTEPGQTPTEEDLLLRDPAHSPSADR